MVDLTPRYVHMRVGYGTGRVWRWLGVGFSRRIDAGCWGER